MTDTRDEVELVFPTRRISVDYERPYTFLRWTFWRRVRKTFVLRTRSLGELAYVQNMVIQMRAKLGQADLRVVGAAIIGREAAWLPKRALEAIWDVHCEMNDVPKDLGPIAAGPSPTTRSSDGSSEPPSTTAESASSN